jgi:hypothetical protein
MDNSTPELEAAWTKKKHIIHEEDIISRIPSTVIGGDTLLRDNPISFPVQDAKLSETPAVSVTVPIPASPTEQSGT